MAVTLDDKLKAIPRSPGVYLYKDAAGKIIYIGKAKNLRNRVRSYFQAGRAGDISYEIKTAELVNQIADFEFIVTDTEAEAFILEASLVKQHQPYFNYKLKDDKSYPHLKLTVNEPFPKCVITRRIQNDGALYFGPFLPASMARKTIDLINRTFQLRTCDIEIDGKAPRPCLEYHIKRCLGPCVKGLCTPAEYQEAVRDVRMLLEGRNTELANTSEEREQTLRAAKDGHDFGKRPGHLWLLSRRQAIGAATVYHARRRHRRPARVFLGRFTRRRLQPGGILE